MHVFAHVSAPTHTFTHSAPLTYTRTQFIWGKCDLRRQAATTHGSIRVPEVALVAIVKQIMLCDWKKKTIQKVICDLWDQYCAASVTSKQHMSVSNGKRYAVQPACRVIKAVGLYIRSVTVTVASTGIGSILAYLQNVQHAVLYTWVAGQLEGLVTA